VVGLSVHDFGATLPSMMRRVARLVRLVFRLALWFLPVALLGSVGVAPAPASAGAVRFGAPLAPAGPGTPVGEFRWPLVGTPVVTRPFQPPPRPWLPGHRGVDLAGTPGQPVVAAGSGTVAFAGIVAGTGVVSIDHAGGLRTTYEPVSPLVRAGQQVTVGQPVGTLLPGHPGCPMAACLHWGLRQGRDYLDPLVLLRVAHVRLLPTSGPAG
jgi:murein DD-endopeptidase MepM/ murein hydrolase activator NlpD